MRTTMKTKRTEEEPSKCHQRSLYDPWWLRWLFEFFFNGYWLAFWPGRIHHVSERVAVSSGTQRSPLKLSLVWSLQDRAVAQDE